MGRSLPEIPHDRAPCPDRERHSGSPTALHEVSRAMEAIRGAFATALESALSKPSNFQSMNQHWRTYRGEVAAMSSAVEHIISGRRLNSCAVDLFKKALAP